MSALTNPIVSQAVDFSRALTADLPGSGFLVVDTELCLVHAEGDAHIVLDRETTIGRHVCDIVPAVAWNVLEAHYAAALAGSTRRLEYEATTGTTHALQFVPVRGAAEPVGVVVLSRDITAEVEVRRRLEASEQLQASVLDVLDEGILVVDREGRLLRANAGASAILGVDLDDVDCDGDWWSRFAPRRRDGANRRLEVGTSVMESGQGVSDVPVELDRPDGRCAALSFNYLPLRDRAGAISGLVLSFHDVTELERARRGLTSTRELLQGTLDSLPAHIAVLDSHGEILMTNRAWQDFAETNGFEHGQLRGNYLTVCDALGDEPTGSAPAAGIRAILSGAEASFSMEYPCHSATHERWFVLQAARYDGQGPARVVLAHVDITQRVLAEREVARQAALLDEVDVSVVATDTQDLITHWNHGAEQLYGWARSKVIGRPMQGLLSTLDPEQTSALQRHGRWEGEAVMARRDGVRFPAHVHARLMVDGDGEPAGMISVAVDVSERVAAEHRLLRTRNYLRAVADNMGEGLFTIDPDGCVMFMNQAAEELLDWTAREAAGQLIHDVIHASGANGCPFPVENSPILRAQRDGIAVRVEDDVFFRRDGRALPVAYTASPFQTDDGIEGYVVVFADVTERKARHQSLQREIERLSWIERIQDAIAESRLVLYAQPIVDSRTREVLQCELLLRLREPTGEIVGPAALLKAAEEFNLIGEIDRWVIRHGIHIAATGRAVSLNLSAHSVGDGAVLEHIERTIAESGADPSRVVFEFTETAMVRDQEAAFRFAERLHTLGCKLALDDFGTGYGGFTHLKKLPVDYLKIDIEFVRDVVVNAGSREVVQAVVALARGFGLKTVAEGVEDAGTLERLVELGVDLVQGYHIARPSLIEPSSDEPASSDAPAPLPPQAVTGECDVLRGISSPALTPLTGASLPPEERSAAVAPLEHPEGAPPSEEQRCADAAGRAAATLEGASRSRARARQALARAQAAEDRLHALARRDAR
ncbi:MAG TPA: EAL domain-containing protein [Solirubrobacteraceae bacterium]|nr:EAL domain-containing protein [Solirubrobacteraceae bacterium]